MFPRGGALRGDARDMREWLLEQSGLRKGTTWGADYWDPGAAPLWQPASQSLELSLPTSRRATAATHPGCPSSAP